MFQILTRQHYTWNKALGVKTSKKFRNLIFKLILIPEIRVVYSLTQLFSGTSSCLTPLRPYT